MADTGHAKNVANFETIIIILTNLGALYDPAQALILLSALQDKLLAAKAAMATDSLGAGKIADDGRFEAERARAAGIFRFGGEPVIELP